MFPACQAEDQRRLSVLVPVAAVLIGAPLANSAAALHDPLAGLVDGAVAQVEMDVEIGLFAG